MSFNYHTLFLRLANKDLKDLISIWMFRFFTLRENAGLVVAAVVGYAYVYTPPRTGPHWQLVKALGAFGLLAPLGNISPPLWPVVASHLCDIQQIPNDFKRNMKYNIQLCIG